MDRGRDELWRLLANKFVRDTAPPVGGVQIMPATTDAEALLVRWRAQDYAGGQQLHRPVPPQPRYAGAWLAGSKKTSAWSAGEAGSTFEFRTGGRPQGQCPELGHRARQACQGEGGAFARVSAPP